VTIAAAIARGRLVLPGDVAPFVAGHFLNGAFVLIEEPQMFQGLKDWYNQPFNSSMTTTKWFLFIGLLLVLLAVWKVIIFHLQEAA
jgi:hypothetical protein